MSGIMAVHCVLAWATGGALKETGAVAATSRIVAKGPLATRMSEPPDDVPVINAQGFRAVDGLWSRVAQPPPEIAHKHCFAPRVREQQGQRRGSRCDTEMLAMEDDLAERDGLPEHLRSAAGRHSVIVLAAH
jgi:hypothetical protein